MATRIFIRVSDLTGYADGDEVSGLTDAAGVVWEFAGAKPIYKVVSGKPCLRFNGTSQGLKTASAVDFTNTDKLTIFSVFKTNANPATFGILAELSNNFNAGNAFAIYPTADGTVAVGLQSSGAYSILQGVSAFNSLKLLQANFDKSLATNEVTARVDRTASGSGYLFNDNTGGNFASETLYVGARGGTSQFLSFDLYYLRIEDATLTNGQITAIEDECADAYNLSFAPPALINFEDNFNRADASDLGANYSPSLTTGLSAPNFSITSNQAFINHASSAALVKIAALSENSYSKLKITEISGAGAAALAARIKPNGAFYFGGVWNDGTFTRIGRYSPDGTFTALATFPDFSAQPGDEIFFNVTGQLLELFLKRDGVLTKIGDYTDNSSQKITGTGRNGILASFAANKIDDYRASATQFLDLIPPSDVVNLSIDAEFNIDSNAATDNVAVAGYLTQYSDDGDAWSNFSSAAKAFVGNQNLPATAGPHIRTIRRKAIDLDGNLSVNWSPSATVSYFIEAADLTQSYSPNTSLVAPIAIQFTDTTPASVTNYYWDFGDWTTSTAPNPKHTFLAPGVYTVYRKALVDGQFKETSLEIAIGGTAPTTGLVIFDEAELPRHYLSEPVGGPTFATMIFGNPLANQQRDSSRLDAIHRFKVSFTDKPEEVLEFLNIFMTRRGQAYGFRFFPPFDNNWNNEEIAKTNTSQSVYKLIRTYRFAGRSHIRRIIKPCPDLVVTINSNPAANYSAYSIDYTKGEITFTNPANLPANGSLRVTGEYCIPVYFATDDYIPTAFSAYNEVQGMEIIEILPVAFGLD